MLMGGRSRAMTLWQLRGLVPFTALERWHRRAYLAVLTVMGTAVIMAFGLNRLRPLYECWPAECWNRPDVLDSRMLPSLYSYSGDLGHSGLVLVALALATLAHQLLRLNAAHRLDTIRSLYLAGATPAELRWLSWGRAAGHVLVATALAPVLYLVLWWGQVLLVVPGNYVVPEPGGFVVDRLGWVALALVAVSVLVNVGDHRLMTFHSVKRGSHTEAELPTNRAVVLAWSLLAVLAVLGFLGQTDWLPGDVGLRLNLLTALPWPFLNLWQPLLLLFVANLAGPITVRLLVETVRSRGGTMLRLTLEHALRNPTTTGRIMAAQFFLGGLQAYLLWLPWQGLGRDEPLAFGDVALHLQAFLRWDVLWASAATLGLALLPIVLSLYVAAAEYLHVARTQWSIMLAQGVPFADLHAAWRQHLLLFTLIPTTLVNLVIAFYLVVASPVDAVWFRPEAWWLAALLLVGAAVYLWAQAWVLSRVVARLLAPRLQSASAAGNLRVA